MLHYGFTAEQTFFRINQLKGFRSYWLHDEGVLRLHSYLYNAIPGAAIKNDILYLDFKYSSFVKINLEIEDVKNDCYAVKVTFVVEHPPLVFLETFVANGTVRADFCRFPHKVYYEDVKTYWDDLIDASAFQMTYIMKVCFCGTTGLLE